MGWLALCLSAPWLTAEAGISTPVDSAGCRLLQDCSWVYRGSLHTALNRSGLSLAVGPLWPACSSLLWLGFLYQLSYCKIQLIENSTETGLTKGYIIILCNFKI
jgi:hypothetical protein